MKETDRTDILTVRDEEVIVPKEGFADLINDYMFKRIFGSEECKDILITFLNHIIGDTVIDDVIFLNSERLGPTEDDRKVVFDVSCRSISGEEFIVEIQNAPQEHFRERALYYCCYPLIRQGEMVKTAYLKKHGVMTGFHWDYALKPVKLIGIVNFRMSHHEGWTHEKFHSSYHLREDGDGELLVVRSSSSFWSSAGSTRRRKSLSHRMTSGCTCSRTWST